MYDIRYGKSGIVISTYDASEVRDAAEKILLWNGRPLGGVTCPRCKGSGEELVFMHYHTCQICEGAKTVPKQTADDENTKRESEEAWLKNK